MFMCARYRLAIFASWQNHSEMVGGSPPKPFNPLGKIKKMYKNGGVI